MSKAKAPPLTDSPAQNVGLRRRRLSAGRAAQAERQRTPVRRAPGRHGVGGRLATAEQFAGLPFSGRIRDSFGFMAMVCAGSHPDSLTGSANRGQVRWFSIDARATHSLACEVWRRSQPHTNAQ